MDTKPYLDVKHRTEIEDINQIRMSSPYLQNLLKQIKSAFSLSALKSC